MLIDVTAAEAEIDAHLLALDVQRARAGQGCGQRLRAPHAAQACGQHPTALEVGVVMLATGLDEGFVGALDDPLAADVDPAAGGHLAVHGQALGVEFVEVLPARPVRHQVGVGDQHARGIAVGFEHADRFTRLHQQGFVVVEVGQALDDFVVALPVARRAANATVHHQFLGVLGHLRVEVVHQHAQRRFGQPALGGQRVAAGGADFNVTVLRRLLAIVRHEKTPQQSIQTNPGGGRASQCATTAQRRIRGRWLSRRDSYAYVFTCTYKHMQSCGQLANPSFRKVLGRVVEPVDQGSLRNSEHDKRNQQRRTRCYRSKETPPNGAFSNNREGRGSR